MYLVSSLGFAFPKGFDFSSTDSLSYLLLCYLLLFLFPKYFSENGKTQIFSDIKHLKMAEILTSKLTSKKGFLKTPRGYFLSSVTQSNHLSSVLS